MSDPPDGTLASDHSPVEGRVTASENVIVTRSTLPSVSMSNMVIATLIGSALSDGAVAAIVNSLPAASRTPEGLAE